MSDPRDRASQTDLFDLPLDPPSSSDGLPDDADPDSGPARSEGTAAPNAAQYRQAAFEIDDEAEIDSDNAADPADPADERVLVEQGPPVPATLGRRLLSGAADILVHAGALATAVLGLDLMGVEQDTAYAVPLLLLVLSFSFLYTVISLAFWGQTAGMAWLGIAARQSPQFPLSFNQATMRWLGGLLTFSLAGLPLLLTLGGGSLSDRISRSTSYQGFFEMP